MLNTSKDNHPPHFVSTELKYFLEQNYETEEILLLIKSNLSLSGDYASVWLCITNKSLLIIDEKNLKISLYQETNLLNIKSISNLSLKGGGLIVYQNIQEKKIDLLRFPDSQAFLFSSVVDRLKRYGKNDTLNFENLKSECERLIRILSSIVKTTQATLT